MCAFERSEKGMEFCMKNLREKLEYHQEKDYLIPNIAIKNNLDNYQIGKYGYLRLDYLKKYKRGYYTELMIEGTLPEHIVAIDKETNMQVNNIVKNLAKANNVDEILKQSNQFDLIRLMNNFKNSAEEIILKELIYN